MNTLLQALFGNPKEICIQTINGENSFSILFSFILMFPFMHCPKKFLRENKTTKRKHLDDSLQQLVLLLIFIIVKMKAGTIYVAYIMWLKIIGALHTLSTKFQVHTFKCLLDPTTWKSQRQLKLNMSQKQLSMSLTNILHYSEIQWTVTKQTPFSHYETWELQ